MDSLTQALHPELVERGRAVLASDPPADPRRDRTIWMFWGGPIPDHLLACIGRADQLRGALGLVVVTPETARAVASTLPRGWEDLPTWAHRSDVLAPHLLAAHGGLYMDVDTVPLRPIDGWVTAIAGRGDDFVTWRNQWDGPSVGVMWGRAGSEVARRYCDLLDRDIAAGLDELRWTQLGTPVLREAIERSGRRTEDLDPMLGHVALFNFRAWRTLRLPEAPLDPYLRCLPHGGRHLAMVALYNSRSGDMVGARREPTMVDALLRADPSAPPAPSIADERTTVVVKTFNRPRTVTESVRRIRSVLPQAPVAVIDDGADEHLADLRAHDVAHLVMAFDVGLSRGRNLGVQMAATDYVLLLDDDQFPAADFDLGQAVDILDRHPDLDGVGGWEDETPHVRDHLELLDDGTLVQTRHRAWDAIVDEQGSFPLHHMVQNQVLWRRAVFDRERGIRWTDRLKVGEHVDFFFRYRGRLRLGVVDGIHVANVAPPLRWADEVASDYGRFRGRQGRMWNRFKEAQGVERIRVDDGVVTDFEFRDRPGAALLWTLAHRFRRPRGGRDRRP